MRTTHSRARPITLVSRNYNLAMMFCMAALLLLQLATIDAYSILPFATRRINLDPRVQWKDMRHWQSRLDSKSSLSLPKSLWASRSFDYGVRNATSAVPSVLDEDEMQLLRFMDDALLELESFQTDSEMNVHQRDFDKADRNSNVVVSDNNIHHDNEVSLLFPPFQTAGTDTANDASSFEGSAFFDTTALQRKEDTTGDTTNLDGIWRARWLLVAAAALYGTNFSVVKLLGDEMPVGISTSLRFGLAALATLPWLVQGYLPLPGFQNSNQKEDSNNRRIMATLYGLEVGLWNSIGYVAQAVGLETTLASESAFLCSMAVVIVPLLDWITGKKLLSRQWVGALMALVGVAFLELGDVDALGSTSLGLGAQLSLIQPFTFGLGFWRMEQAMHEYPEEAPRMTAAQLMAIFVSSVGYGLWTVGAFEPVLDSANLASALAGFQASLIGISTDFPWREWSHNPSILFSLFWTGCVTTALTIYMETLALESLSAAETTLIFSTEPLWGTAFAVAVMGEQMGLNSVVGAGLILTACVYSNLGVDGLQDIWTSTMESLSGRNNGRKSTTRPENRDLHSSLSQSLPDHWP